MSEIQDDGLYDADFVRGFFGGNKPIDRATLYRGIKAGRFSPPVHPSPGMSRWVGRDLRADKQRILDGSREPLPSPKTRAVA